MGKVGMKKDWVFRFIKGMFVGSGFILPGVSGGALAAIFGIYERIISFLANITKNVKENMLFFLPIGLGGMTSVFLLSFVVSFLLGSYETIILWFFVGCIVGTAPSLWKEAGKNGRSKTDGVIMILTFVLGFIFLWKGASTIGIVDQNFFTWMLAGALIGLGVIVPGLSPSNFLVYMGMYKSMSDAIYKVDVMVLLPLAIGGLLTVLTLSKVMNSLFLVAYSSLFHFILGIVFASTIMIIPLNYSGFSGIHYFSCLLLFIMGIALGAWMSRLEEKYK